MKRLPKSDRTLQRARRLRRDMSDEERILWMLLRDRRFADFKFRRQVPLGVYVADFVCFERKLVLELDGSQHAEPEQAAFDAERTAYLEAAGFRVARLWCSDLFKDRDGALQLIWDALTSPSPLVGEGGSARSAETDEGNGARFPTAARSPLTRTCARGAARACDPSPTRGEERGGALDCERRCFRTATTVIPDARSAIWNAGDASAAVSSLGPGATARPARPAAITEVYSAATSASAGKCSRARSTSMPTMRPSASKSSTTPGATSSLSITASLEKRKYAVLVAAS